MLFLAIGVLSAAEPSGYGELRASYSQGVDGTPWQVIERFRPTVEADLSSNWSIKLTAEAIGGHGRYEPDVAFDLVDEQGMWVKCCAWGRNARVKHFVEGSEVILYFATAKSGAGGVGVCLWLFRDGLLVVVGPQTPTRVKRIELDLRM